MGPATPQRVLIVGGGHTGQMFADRCLRAGVSVAVFDQDPAALSNRQAIHPDLAPVLGVSVEELAAQERRLSTLAIELDAARAARNVDLLIECVPERIALKREVFAQFAGLCPPHAVFVTNTSTLLPSSLASYTQRPERFAAFHILNETGLVEIMGHAGTSLETIAGLEAFARRIDLLPIVCRKELTGYLLNRLTMPMHFAALKLVAQGAVTFEDVDRLWMRTMQVTSGPFGQLDRIGLDTVLEINRQRAKFGPPDELAPIVALLEKYVSEGRLGVKTLRGFYDYPHPRYLQVEFLTDGFLEQQTLIATATKSSSAPPNALIDHWEMTCPDAACARLIFDPVADALLRDHVYKETPLVPAAAMIELCAEALTRLDPPEAEWVLEHVTFVNGIRCFTPAPQAIELALTKNGDHWDLRLTHEFRNRAGVLLDAHRLCATASARLDDAAVRKASPNVAPVDAVWQTVVYADTGINRFGPAMRGLRHICLQPDRGWGEILVEPSDRYRARPGTRWCTCPGMLDAALVACNVWLQVHRPGWVQLPQTVEQLRLGPHPVEGSRVRTDFRVLSIDETSATYELVVSDDQGCQLMELLGYRCVLLRDAGAPPLHLEPRTPVS